MAYITYGSTTAAFPTVYSDPKYPKDIVINGILFDIDTFTPKIGSHVMMWTGDYSPGGTKTYSSYDDDDAPYFGLWNNDSLSGQYTTSFSPNYPYVQRDIKTDGTHWDTASTTTFCFNYIMGQTAIYGRDFLQHPLKCSHYNETTSEYIDMFPNLNYTGSGATYEGSDGWTRYQDRTWTYDQYSSHLWDADTDSGCLYTELHSSTTVCIQKLAVRNYASDAQLHTNTKTQIYSPSTTNPVFIHHLTKSNNGDHFFYAQQGASAVGAGKDGDLLRYDNSSNSVTVEFNDFQDNYSHTHPLVVPSNVVYHQKTGDTSTTKKICYLWRQMDTTFDAASNKPWFIEMDVANNTISRTQTTGTLSTLNSTYDDMWNSSFSEGEGPYVLTESRILSASQDINSQKYLFVFLQSNGYSHGTTYDHCFMILKISASDPLALSPLSSTTTYGQWDDILTASSKNTAVNDIMPWCVAPLNVEHTLMMVYTKYSTHLVKFDTSNETFSEIWMDDDTYFNEVMWLPSGKILTGQYENKFSSLSATVDYHAPKAIQVWSEDLIYNVDITTSSNYVTYSGSDVSNTLSISAYDGGNSRVATDLTLKIVGPAVFDNSTKTKTVTTSTSAAVTETITINDDGHVEVKVIEIQS